jgi:WD40 repeat protein
MCLRLFNGGAADGDGGGCQTYLASLWENGQLYLWDSRKPSAPFASTAAAAGPEAKRMHDEPPLAFDLAVVGNGCGVRGVSGGADTHIGIFSASLPAGPDTSDTGDSVSLEGTAEVLHQLRPSDPATEPITVEQRLEVGHAGVGSVAIRGDQRIFATGGWDKRVRVWDFKRLRPLAILKAHAGPVNCVVFSNTDNLLVSGSADTRIACWSLY